MRKSIDTTVSAGLLLTMLFLVGGADNALVDTPYADDRYVNTPYVAEEYILLSCGFSGVQTDQYNRTWTGDSDSEYASSLNATGSQALQHDSSVNEVPYSTARVFTESYTYYFPLGSGRKYIRFHFYPANYSTNHSAYDALFSVTSGTITFLANFNASATVQASNFQYLIKEYSVNVTMGGLNLTFTPSKSFANAYAFVNGIEIISTPDLFLLKVPWLSNDWNIIPKSLKQVDPDWALETIHRLNVGGESVSPIEDSGLYRSWNTDVFVVSDWLYSYNADDNVSVTYTIPVPSYMAPKVVYLTARLMGPVDRMNLRNNITWLLNVDAGFEYLVRFHFCEIQYDMENQRVFDILVKNQIAEKGFDVFFWSDGLGIPVYMDYVVSTTGVGKMDLPITLHPNQISSPQHNNVILNALEIFKLQNKNGSLAGLNPIVEPWPPADARKSKNTLAIVGGIIGGFLVLLIAGFIFVWFYRHHKRKGKDAPSAEIEGKNESMLSNTDTTECYTSSGTSSKPCVFTFDVIRNATDDFDVDNVIGQGKFGEVYQGEINGGIRVAIKRGNLKIEHAECELRTEIEILSKTNHKNIVTLIGYCIKDCGEPEIFLVYDYMEHGSLDKHLNHLKDLDDDNLYKPKGLKLSWSQRLEICIELAQGLHYLHGKNIIHRDIKTKNILLDRELVPKISDFGLSKLLVAGHSHVSTEFWGTPGYADPEYQRSGHLHRESDVFSFGVVLFQVLCAQQFKWNLRRQVQVKWVTLVKKCQKEGHIYEIVDPCLNGMIARQCLEIFVDTALKCVEDTHIVRPSMEDVLNNLISALEKQKMSDI